MIRPVFTGTFPVRVKLGITAYFNLYFFVFIHIYSSH